MGLGCLFWLNITMVTTKGANAQHTLRWEWEVEAHRASLYSPVADMHIARGTIVLLQSRSILTCDGEKRLSGRSIASLHCLYLHQACSCCHRGETIAKEPSVILHPDMRQEGSIRPHTRQHTREMGVYCLYGDRIGKVSHTAKETESLYMHNSCLLLSWPMTATRKGGNSLHILHPELESESHSYVKEK